MLRRIVEVIVDPHHNVDNFLFDRRSDYDLRHVAVEIRGEGFRCEQLSAALKHYVYRSGLSRHVPPLRVVAKADLAAFYLDG